MKRDQIPKYNLYNFQKTIEIIFNEYQFVKENEFDMVTMKKYIEENFGDENWKIILKTTCEECLKRLKFKVNEIEKIKECEVKFMAFVTCVNLEGFLVIISIFNNR